MNITYDMAKPFIDFVVARHHVYLNREAGKPKPWTRDPILQSYRFCNVYRELDTVTRWINDHWRARYEDDPDAWFAMVVARLVNRIETLDVLRPLPWKPEVFEGTMERIMQRGDQAFGAAYIVSTNGHTMRKAAYLRELVLAPMWHHRKTLRPMPGEMLGTYHTKLTNMNGMGSFMAAQVVADLKNMPGPNGLEAAPDWWDWAAPGPGSLRGLNRVRGREGIRTGYRLGEWLYGVHQLQERLNNVLTAKGWEPVCAQDLQNCLCEFDKYQRVKLGEGTPKQRYQGAA